LQFMQLMKIDSGFVRIANLAILDPLPAYIILVSWYFLDYLDYIRIQDYLTERGRVHSIIRGYCYQHNIRRLWSSYS
jgi:hypothetical protein